MGWGSRVASQNQVPLWPERWVGRYLPPSPRDSDGRWGEPRPVKLSSDLLHIHCLHHPKDPVSRRKAQSFLHMCFPSSCSLLVLWYNYIYLYAPNLQSTLSWKRQTHLYVVWGHYSHVKPHYLQPEKHRSQRSSKKSFTSSDMFTERMMQDFSS